MRKNALALALGCALAVVAVEGVLRVIPPTNRFVTYRDAARDIRTPDASFTHKGRNVGQISEFRVRKHTNSLGFADRDYALEKSPGTFRVLVLGDSQVEALQVRLEDSYHKRLEARLRADGHSVEVVALGRSGYDVGDALDTYRELGRDFDPDHVIWGFTDENDVVESSPALRSAVYARTAARIATPPRLLRGSILVSFLYSRRWGREAAAAGSDGDELLPGRYATLAGMVSLLHPMYLEEPPPLYREAVGVFGRDLRALADAVHADGLPLTVVSTAGPYPDFLAELYPDFAWRPRRLDELARRICDDVGVRFLTMKPTFTEHERDTGEAVRFRGDGHLNVRGHDMVADALYAALAPTLLAEASPPAR